VLLELDGDDVAGGDATVGKESVAEAAARGQRAETIERPCARRARAVPAAVLPPPQLLFELRAVPVAVHQGEAIVTIADCDQDPGVPPMPAAQGQDLLGAQPGMSRAGHDASGTVNEKR
jgi:hypothetical protein